MTSSLASPYTRSGGSDDDDHDHNVGDDDAVAFAESSPTHASTTWRLLFGMSSPLFHRSRAHQQVPFNGYQQVGMCRNTKILRSVFLHNRRAMTIRPPGNHLADSPSLGKTPPICFS